MHSGLTYWTHQLAPCLILHKNNAKIHKYPKERNPRVNMHETKHQPPSPPTPL